MKGSVAMSIIAFRRLVDLYTEPGARAIFEIICNEYLCEEFPGTKAIRANPGDFGIDSFQSNFKGGIRVFQVKFFSDQIEDSQKQQIRESFKTAKQHLGDKLKEWILMLPKDLDYSENDWFDQWKIKQGVSIDYWGETKIRSGLNKHEWIQNKYFQNNEVNYRRIIEYLGEIIDSLNRGVQLNKPTPKPELLFLKTKDELCDTLCLPYVPFEYNPPCLAETNDGAKERLVRTYGKMLSETLVEDEFRKFCNVCEEYLEKHKEAAKWERRVRASSYVMFAVQNNGGAPADDVYVEIQFPDEMDVWPESVEQAQQKSKEPKKPGLLEDKLYLMSHPTLREQGTKQSMHYCEKAMANLAYRPHVAEFLARIESNQAGKVRDSIECYPEKKEARFWLKRVMHGGKNDCHCDGIYVMALDEGEHIVKYRIVVGNIETAIEGELKIKTKEDAIQLEYWNPFG